MSNIAKLASAQALTKASAATEAVAVIDGMNVHDIHIAWTPGTADNVLAFTVEVRHVDASGNGSWTQEMEWDGNVAGTTQTNTRILQQYQHTAASTAIVPLIYSLATSGHELRMKISESEAGSSTKGTITIVAFSRKH